MHALYNNEINYNRIKAFVYFKINYFNIKQKPDFAHFREHGKSHYFDVIYCVYKMKQSHWSLCVAKNCDWSRKIAPLSKNLTQVLFHVE